MSKLPLTMQKVKAPPIKCQGIKTKLAPFIFQSVSWSGEEPAKWIEPFLGSGVIALNLRPERALLADTNKHIVSFYQAIQRGEINGDSVRRFLSAEGRQLAECGASYYYEVRERFNEHGSPLDFLFLNRSCFNGIMRFNRKGKFNVPFGHKPHRFSKAYITKICNQVNWAAQQMDGKQWEFRVASWTEVLPQARAEDFVYMDPPYIGRHTDYYNSWDSAEAEALASSLTNLPCGFALSMWLENQYRRNTHIDTHLASFELRSHTHFYHVGSKEQFRNAMDEALIVKPGFIANYDEEPPERTLF